MSNIGKRVDKGFRKALDDVLGDLFWPAIILGLIIAALRGGIPQ